MNEPESKENKPQRQRRFDLELLKKGLKCDLDQYEMLKCCSKIQDGTEWNKWRLEHPDEDIWLQGGDFQRWSLRGTYLNSGPITGGTGTVLRFSGRARLENANFALAYLENSFFNKSLLQGARFRSAHLENVVFYRADMRNTNVEATIVNSATSFWECKVNRHTSFVGTSLEATRIDPATKQLLEYNIRRMNWEEWYEEHPKLKWVVKPFWLMSDYGLSTARIILIFCGAAFIFANIYYHWGRIAPPGIIDNLFMGRDGAVVSWWVVPLRALYFSIITMTLGFSDMYANAHSIWGHILITVQALLGYVLLGALVTRFAVLFTAGGPAGKFADDKEEKATESRVHSERDGQFLT